MVAQSARRAARLLQSRCYATQAVRKSDAGAGGAIKVSKVNDFKLATTDSFSPLSRLVCAVKAGSRYESVHLLGVAHLLRRINHLSTAEIYNKDVVNGLSGLGASVNFHTTRENAYVSVECTRDNLFQAMDIVGPLLMREFFAVEESGLFKECLSGLAYDLAQLNQTPAIKLMELLHAAAFRHGLGNSLYSPVSRLGKLTPDHAVAFLAQGYLPNRMSIVGSGIAHEDLAGLFGAVEIGEPQEFKVKLAQDKTKYVGGESREVVPDHAPYVAVAVEGASLGSESAIPAGIVAEVLGSPGDIPYQQIGAGCRVGNALIKAGIAEPKVAGFSLNYSDSGLLGFSLSVPAEQADKAIDAAMGELSSVASAGITDQEFEAGKQKLKAKVCADYEGTAKLMTLANQLQFLGEATPVEAAVAQIDAVSKDSVNKAAKNMLSGKKSMASIGQIELVPYL